MLEYLFDSEWSQRADIEDLKSRLRRSARRKRRAAAHERREIQELEARVEALEDDLGSLALLTRSLLSSLRERGHIDLDDFVQILHRIDAEDGLIDGQASPRDPTVTAASGLEPIDEPPPQTEAERDPPTEPPVPPIEAPVPRRKRLRRRSAPREDRAEDEPPKYKERENW